MPSPNFRVCNNNGLAQRALSACRRHRRLRLCLPQEPPNRSTISTLTAKGIAHPQPHKAAILSSVLHQQQQQQQYQMRRGISFAIETPPPLRIMSSQKPWSWMAGGGGGSTAVVLLAVAAAAAASDSVSGNARPSTAEKEAEEIIPITTMIQQKQKTRPLLLLNEKYSVYWNAPALGRGAYGSVHLAETRNDDKKEAIAIKRICKQATDAFTLENEVNALLRIRAHGGHAHVLSIRDVFQDEDSHYVVMDLISGGEVFDDLVQQGPYTPAEAARLIHQLAGALHFLHERAGIVHADIKPENLMLSLKGDRSHVTLVDFGCAEDYSSSSSSNNNNNNNKTSYNNARTNNSVRFHRSGTSAYWPPERFNEENHTVTPAMDMWSVGVLFYMLLTNEHPFDNQGAASDQQIQANICNAPNSSIRLPDDCCCDKNGTITAVEEAQDLLNGLLAVDPQQRMTAEQVCNHPWILKHQQQQSSTTPMFS